MPKPPTEQQFNLLVNEFWFEATQVAKYLKRDERWQVKFSDWTTKKLLLKMLEWNRQVSPDWNAETYYNGKHMQQWVEPVVWQDLQLVFAHFDSGDSWNSLLNSTALFRLITLETAADLGVPYLEQVDKNITAYILGLKV